MLFKKNKTPETLASRLLNYERNYGIGNPKGQYFDRIFNRIDTDRKVNASRNSVAQGMNDMLFPNGASPDGYSTYTPMLGISAEPLDPDKIQDAVAQKECDLYWRKNVERSLKYETVAGRSEVNESIIQICNEAAYKDDRGESCSLEIDPDAKIGPATQDILHTTFRRKVLRELLNFRINGWNYMRYLCIHGRIFFEVEFDENKSQILGVKMLREENMIVIYQDDLIIGYRQMQTGPMNMRNGGKNYKDFSPNQILYASLDMTGPGGINDPRSILEPAMKPYNQLNTIEDSVVMYRILWGQEKLVMKVDTGNMPKDKAEKYMKDQAKVFSRKLDYNSQTGEVTNFGKAIGLTEHYIVSLSQGRTGSSIERMQGGNNLQNIDDLKFFKRNLVNSLMVPPGRITALAGDSQNYTQGKIGEVTQSEVSFAALVQRYQTPLEAIMVRLFVMVLNTMKNVDDSIKSEVNFSVRFKRSNGFQNFIESEIWNTRLATFDLMAKHCRSKENPVGMLPRKFALMKGLRVSDEEYNQIRTWLLEEKNDELYGEAAGGGEGEGGGAGGGDAGGLGGLM